MHKTIVQQIRETIERSPFASKVKTYVDMQETGGFWSMAIHVEIQSHIAHIESVADSIGKMYGEQLYFQRDGNWLEIS